MKLRGNFKTCRHEKKKMISVTCVLIFFQHFETVGPRSVLRKLHSIFVGVLHAVLRDVMERKSLIDFDDNRRLTERK